MCVAVLTLGGLVLQRVVSSSCSNVITINKINGSFSSDISFCVVRKYRVGKALRHQL